MGLFSWLFGKKKKDDKKSPLTEETNSSTWDEGLIDEAPSEKVSKSTKVEEKAVKKDAAEENAPAASRKRSVKKEATGKAEKTVNKAEKGEAEIRNESEGKDESVSVVEETVTEGKPTRSGKFDIKRAKDGRYVFNLYASNKVIVATSQIYSSSQSAMTGVKSVIANAEKAPIEDSTSKKPVPQPFPKWEIYIDKAGEYRFRLYASNGSCICHAKAGYSTKSNCKRGIESIIRFASESQIDKSYLNKK